MTRITIRAVLEPSPSGAVSSLGGRLRCPGPRASGGSPPEGLGAYAAGIFTAEPSSTEGALTLLLPIGARGIGMGRAVTASSGPESVFWNPAGLARLEQGRFLRVPREPPGRRGHGILPGSGPATAWEHWASPTNSWTWGTRI